MSAIWVRRHLRLPQPHSPILSHPPSSNRSQPNLPYPRLKHKTYHERSSTQTDLLDFGGRAELARLLFAFGGIAFDGNRVSMPEFGAMKAGLPLGQLPILEVDGVMFSQSLALARCAAKLCGLYPEDSIQALHVDMVSETLVDLTHGFVDIVFHTPDAAARAEKTTKYVAETVPKALAVLEKMVQGKFFAGDSATFADVQLLDMILNFETNFPDFSLAAFPNLASVVESVRANANVATYLAK